MIYMEKVEFSITGSGSDIANKFDYITMYAAADRHGVLEWLYQHEDGDRHGLRRYVALAVWAEGETNLILESTSAVTSAGGVTKHIARRSSVDAGLFFNEPFEVLLDVLNPAFERASAMLVQATELEEAGEDATETKFAVPRHVGL